MVRKFVTGGIPASCVRELTDFAARAQQVVFDFLASRGIKPRQGSRVPSRLMEPLEDRRLLSSISLTSGTLSLAGSNDQRNTITVSRNSAGSYVATTNSTSKTFSASSVSSIKITGGNWNDTIRIDSGITKPSTIDGNAGNDYIAGGGGNDSIRGDVGDDLIWGNNGNDSLFGDAGNDNLDGGSGTDKLDGGTGNDVLKNGETASAISPSTPAAPSSSASISAIEVWNTSTNTKIETLDAGQTLDLAKIPSTFTFVAQGSGASVKFALDSNSSYRTENQKPWSITGDISGKLMPLTLATGSHTVVATPYTKTGATGSAGAGKSVSFNVIRSSTSTGGNTGGSTGGTSGNTGGNTSTGIQPRDNSASSPSAVITAVSSKTIHAGQSFSAHAMSSALNDGTPLTARYAWDFGDSGSKYNTLLGFNAAHYYAKAGTYTVKLTVTNEAGKSHTSSTTVSVLAEGRKKIYVSSSGSDSNDGLSESKPLKTFAKAGSKIADNVEILFKGGDTFSVTGSINIYKHNVVIGSYGSGRATLKFTGGKDYTSMIWLGGQGGGERTVENLIFDSNYTGTDADGMPQAVGAAGVGDTVINNEFRNVGYAVNARSQPRGLLIQDNNAPLSQGLKEYFLWAQGQDLVLLGNNVANTLRGADVRSAGTDRMLMAYNTMANPKDSDGIERGTITIHEGNYFYAANNTFKDGPAATGPLGQNDGLNEKGSRLKWVVLEGNTIERTVVTVLHGSEHYMARNNVIKRDSTSAFNIQGYSSQYGRGVVDATIVNNTVINNGTAGNFIRVEGDVNGINLVNNLFVAPNLHTGTAGSAAVFIYDSDLSSFRKIDGNVWPSPTIDWFADGGINYLWPTWSDSKGYKTPAEWEAYGQVIKDHYEDTSFNSSTFAPSTSSKAASAGVVWGGVFTDKNGKIRSNAGSWTAGAIEV